jgi:16S rRNA (cytidine1402-2'-O)-methyltransferase
MPSMAPEPGYGIGMKSASSNRQGKGVLYVVATPLGNLEDITLRALRVLKGVDLIAAEDTRHSRKLLLHYAIETPLTSYHDHIERQKAPRLVETLKVGKSIALISDAGTPGIADPGFHLVAAAIAAGVRVEAIPGASAVAAALSIAGLPTDRWVFEGFVPAKAGPRRRFLEALAHEPRTIVAYETSRRLERCLRDMRESLGDRRVVIVRELTKMFEEVVRGSVTQVLEHLAERPPQGEVTLLIAGSETRPPAALAEALPAAIERLRGEGLSLKEIARTLSRERNISRRQVYQAGLALGHDTERSDRG